MRNTRGLAVAVITILIAGVALVAAQDYTTKDVKEFTVSADSSFKLENINGDISVSGWDKNVISVEYTKISSGSDAKLKADLVKVLINQRGDRVDVEVDYPDSKERKQAGIRDKSFNVAVEFKVYLPRRCDTDIESVNGEVRIEGLNKNVKVENVNGELFAANLSGDIEVDMTNGEIEMNSVSGEINIESTNGDIKIVNVEGTVEVETTNGGVNVDAGKLDGLSVENVNGAIEVSSDTPIIRGRFEIKTFNGEVDLELPADSAFELIAETSFMGKIKNEFTLEGVTINKDHRGIRGTVNGGGAQVKVKTSMGTIRVRRR